MILLRFTDLLCLAVCELINSIIFVIGFKGMHQVLKDRLYNIINVLSIYGYFRNVVILIGWLEIILFPLLL